MYAVIDKRGFYLADVSEQGRPYWSPAPRCAIRFSEAEANRLSKVVRGEVMMLPWRNLIDPQPQPPVCAVTPNSDRAKRNTQR